MSNIKEIKIVGELPFDCTEYYELCKFLGQLNGPSLNLQIKWGKQRMIPNELCGSPHKGGQTSYYQYVIDGEEAVSIGWIDSLLKAIVEAKGTIEQIDCTDIENCEPNYEQTT